MLMRRANVTLVSRSITREDDVVQEIEALGRKTAVVTVDVANKASVLAMVKKIKPEFGQIDILVRLLERRSGRCFQKRKYWVLILQIIKLKL